ncbi:hypothetical protein [Streptomyces sp. NPDC091268]|uniref:hypothetical protein n=1 Tax=Streptomyces sp. NPDC091268 TaxID=3365979 RepID=UPI00382041FE
MTAVRGTAVGPYPRRAAVVAVAEHGLAAGAAGGGDAGLMDAFVGAVAAGDPGLVESGPRASLACHLTVLAAERARRNGTVEPVPFP